MKKRLIIFMCCGLFTVFSFIFINALKTGAESKKTLEEIVMDQQMTIDSLKLQLADTNKRLTALEDKQTNTDQYENRLSQVEKTIGFWDTPDVSISQSLIRNTNELGDRINYLEQLHSIDKTSIQDYVEKLPTTMRNELSLSIDMSATECQMRGDCTELPLHVEFLWANIGNSNYNLLDYISKEQIIDITKAAYNDVKQPEKVIPQKINIYISQPFETSAMTIEVPLD